MSFFGPVFDQNPNRQTYNSHYPIRAPVNNHMYSNGYQVSQASPSPHSRAQALPLPIASYTYGERSSENQPLLSDNVPIIHPQLQFNAGMEIPRITYTPPCPPSLPAPAPVPEYSSPSSPPKYAPLPSSSEGTVLLAPPPNFYAATCPHQANTNTNNPDIESQNSSVNLIISHSCPHCFQLPSSLSDQERRRRENQYDWVVLALIVLNVLVWGAVIYGYYREWQGGNIWIPNPDGDFNMGAGIGAGVGFAPDQGYSWAKCVDIKGDGKGWTRMCVGGDCTWALVDC